MPGSFVTARIDIRVPIKDARDVDEIMKAGYAITACALACHDEMKERGYEDFTVARAGDGSLRIRSPRRSRTEQEVMPDTGLPRPAQHATTAPVSESAGAGPAETFVEVPLGEPSSREEMRQIGKDIGRAIMQRRDVFEPIIEATPIEGNDPGPIPPPLQRTAP